MLKLTAILLTALAALAPASIIHAEGPVSSVKALIDQESARAGLNVACMERLNQRESGGDPYAVNPSSGATGPFQFMRSNSVWFSSPQAAEGDDPSDPFANVRAAVWLQARGFGATGWGIDCRF